ncbi:MAG: Ribosomal large subunit pseudouridine synthase D [Alphaproteobacteria bacterium MarineAlpha11_Bin1]|nr:MAG: Ribosomal large subunit pseudouridine synthase D [Alphaproteobacteria bacterium MarineAlpha11_Bin1]|tara:strand:- start:6143 stop:7174 length:1032 start_codon:yes stop_codon:yes gene_type:complete
MEPTKQSDSDELSPLSRIEISVAPGAEGERLDRVLASSLPDRSRSFLKRLIEDGRLQHNNQAGETIVEPSYRVKSGEKYLLEIPEAIKAEPVGEDIPLDVIFEDEDLIVIDKPAGLVVHPAPGNPSGTLVNALIAHCGDSLQGIGGVRRPGIVHRLDKDTSGLIVAAKTGPAHEGLTTQFSDRSVDREYSALVWGLPRPPSGAIDGNIGRSRRDRKKMSVRREGGKLARTNYKVEAVYNGGAASLLKCRLETGRTHQIRVHFANLGHPVIGDPLYGGGVTQTRLRSVGTDAGKVIEKLVRQTLHARRLGFVHPITGKYHCFESKLPAEICEIIKILCKTGNFS